MSQDDIQQNSFSLIADFDGDMSTLFTHAVDEVLPILPLRNMTLFPGVVAPVAVGRESSRQLIRRAVKSGSLIGVVAQRDAAIDTPTMDDLYPIGTLAKVMRVIELPDDALTVILQGHQRIRLGQSSRMKPYIRARVDTLVEELPEENDAEFRAIVDNLRESTVRLLRMSESVRDEAAFAIRNISHPVFLVSFIATNLPFPVEEKQNLLEVENVKERARRLLAIVNREEQYARLKQQIREQTREELDRQQKEYFLQQQMKKIQTELGGEQEGDVLELKEKAAAMNWPEKIAQLFEREVNRLSHISQQSPDYNVQLNYLQTLLTLPWGKVTEDNLNIRHAERVLEQGHYGLEKVKERILEHLALLRFSRERKAPILCLYGPPGVGKTSLGRSIAEAIGRRYVRISLGGVHDEAEIRGHRRTYVGAMPGRIVKGLIKAGTDNPVFVLDEIDKVASVGHNGDPSAALLEVLDPEQNATFHDNFLDIDYDLSSVLFIATANSLGTLPRPLLDRMELIPVDGYLTEEKKEIARRHLVPREARDIDFGPDTHLKFSAAAIETIIEKYTRESGVRELEKLIGKVFRKVAYRASVDGGTPLLTTALKSADVIELLGRPPYLRDQYQGNDYAGVVTGLAWTAVGGEILFVEAGLNRSKTPTLTLTGNLGDVMKESAMLALEYVKAHADALNIDYRVFEEHALHIHVPEGATPKDGPSAGITIATAIASAVTGRRVRAEIAMTGEITLRGKVLPVGGIKEKILAAKRAGIKHIVISADNRSDIEEIKAKYVNGLTFHYVQRVDEVLDYALLEEKAPAGNCL